MRQSQLFTKTLREAPKDEASVNAILLTRGAFIDKLAAGIYTFLPLGLRVLRKIENVIREEMTAIGGQEILMPALQPKENWDKTDRWNHFDALLKLKAFGDKDFGLGPTHEEVVSPLAKKLILSYKDLPLYLFQIQTKFRNEARAKSGLLRGREFLMKDLYSFHASQDDLDDYYRQATDSYFKIFDRCGLGAKTYLTAASGGTFSKYSHEFQTLTDAGEDHIHICTTCKTAVNEEIIHEHKICPECSGKDFKKEKAYHGSLEDFERLVSAAQEYALEKMAKSIKDSLAKFGVKHDVWFPESELESKGEIDKVLYNLNVNNLSYEKDGALWFKASDFGFDSDVVIKKSTGFTTYLLSDFAYARDKLKRGFDLMIYILGADHHADVARIKSGLRAMKLPEEKFKDFVPSQHRGRCKKFEEYLKQKHPVY